VPLNLHFGPETLRDGVDIDAPAFYRRLTTDQVQPTTSQPSPGVFAEAYRSLAGEADAIVSIHISSKLSGTHNSALLGVLEAKLEIPIDVLDSSTVSLAFGLVVAKAARAARDGASREEVSRLA
jgi:DegV family protein with EDD domain